MSEENKAVVDRLTEVFNSGDVGLVDELVAEDFVENDPIPDGDADREGFKQMIVALRDAFPDLEVGVARTIDEDDLVVTHWTSTGTHQGEFMGAPATGNTVSIDGIDISRLEDGVIVEHWGKMDAIALMQQLGAMDEAETTETEAAKEEATA
jgi:steroid delta-isomerase-like uncharacterized protein